MKKVLSLFLALFISLAVASCSNGADNSETTKPQSNEISADATIRPTEDKLDETDYSLFADGSKMPDFDKSKWYRNDLKNVALPDPYVIEENGTYFIYGTTDRTGARVCDCYSTTDFNDFQLHMNIYKPTPGGWEGTTTGIFAPEVLYYEGYYYYYYSNESALNGVRYINVARSESPVGPFLPIEDIDADGKQVNGFNAPIFDHVTNTGVGFGVLDQTIFVDDDGKMYMYYSVYHDNWQQYIVGIEMKDPITPDWSTYKVLVRPGEMTPETGDTNILTWEAYTSFEVAEGPQMIKSPNGKYYLTYSVNHYPNRYYTVCYAYSDSPLGDYVKPYTKEDKQNNITWTNLLFGYAGGFSTSKVYEQWGGFMSGTAHHCFFKIGDQWMIGYHAHRDRETSEHGRMFGMDYLFFDENGVPYCEGPTWSIQPLPEAISGYKNIALNANVKSLNVVNPERINDNYVTTHYNLPQQANREVTLNSGYSYIELVFDKEYIISGISVYNSAYYEKAITEIEYVNFFNDNAIFNFGFIPNYIIDDKEFIFVASSFVADFDEIKADRVVLCFNNAQESQINEIKIYGREA